MGLPSDYFDLNEAIMILNYFHEKKILKKQNMWVKKDPIQVFSEKKK